MTLTRNIERYRRVYIKRRIAMFKMRLTNTRDEPRSGCPVEVTTPEIVDKIHGISLKDRKLNLLEIAGTLNISNEVYVIYKLIFWASTRSV